MYTINLPRSFLNNSLFTFPNHPQPTFILSSHPHKTFHIVLSFSDFRVSSPTLSLLLIFSPLQFYLFFKFFFFPSPKKLFFSSYAFFYFFFSPCHLLCFIPFFFLFLFWNNKFAFQLVLTKTNQYAQNGPKLYLRWTQNDIHNIGI